LHDRKSRLREIDGTEKMNPQHLFEIVEGHLEKALVLENPRIINKNVQPPKAFHSGGDDFSRSITVRHTVAIGNGAAALFTDLFYHLQCAR
jgi:hypothetical protein